MIANLRDLPLEIIDHILSLLQPRDVVRVQSVCKHLHSAIKSSSMIQYIIGCYAFGMVDNNQPGLAYSERLELLQQREGSWRRLRPTHRYDIQVPFEPSGLYDFTGGVFVLGVGSRDTAEAGKYAYTHLPPAGDTSSPEWKFGRLEDQLVDFGLSVHEHDLIAIVTQRLQSRDTTCELHFRTLSGSEPHPEASQAAVKLYDGVVTDGHPSALIEISGDYVAILLIFPNMSTPEKLYLVDWRKGAVRLIDSYQPRTYSGLAWLSEDAIVIPNISEASLDIFRMSRSDSSLVPNMTIVCRLKFPRLRPTARMVSAYCRAEPNPSSAPSKSGSRDRPFYCPPESAILVVTFMVMNLGERVSLAVIVHRSSLLKFLPDGDYLWGSSGTIVTFQYNEWGVRSTSWFLNDSTWITTTAGQIYTTIMTGWAVEDDDENDETDGENVGARRPTRQLCMLDFNPLHVQAALSCPPPFGTGVAGRLIAGPRTFFFLHPYFLEGEVPRFELPYVERVRNLPEIPKDIAGRMYVDAWVDEQRIMLIRLDPLAYEIRGADVLVLG